MKKLLCGADVLMMQNGEWLLVKNGFVGINNETIDYVGAERPTAKYDNEKKLKGQLLMPGLYNMHTHSAMTLLRGVGSGLPLDKWLFDEIIPIEDRMIGEDIRVGSQLAIMEMLKCGVVSFHDMYINAEITAEEVIKAGMRANLCCAITGTDEDEDECVKMTYELFDGYHNAANGQILIDFSIHGEYTSTPRLVENYAKACLNKKALMHLHISETKKEHEECIARHGVTPSAYFNRLGVFENPTVAAHCVMASDEDIEILAQKGVTVVHNPGSNMKLASGFMPLKKMLKSGVNVTLGTDGAASNNNLNLFEEMHLASIIHNGYNNDPVAIQPAELLTLATVNGAKAQGRVDCGNIAVGMKADMIAINMDAPHLMPTHDVPSLLVYSAQASDVSMTMVNGNVLYENGEFLTMDYERMKHALGKSIARLLG